MNSGGVFRVSSALAIRHGLPVRNSAPGFRAVLAAGERDGSVPLYPTQLHNHAKMLKFGPRGCVGWRP